MLQPMAPTYNVIGVLNGTDPRLRRDYVAFTAHYDAVNSSWWASGSPSSSTGQDSIANGADDNASGTAAVLAAAEVLAVRRPRRSVLVAFFTAEELGLTGSEYFTGFEPTIPTDRLIAVLNADMIARSRSGEDRTAYPDLTGRDTVHVAWDRTPASTPVWEAIRRANDAGPRLVVDGSLGPERVLRFRGSDHYSFFRRGVPAVWFFTGVHPDWHRPTDEADRFDWAKLWKVAQLIRDAGWRLASPTKRGRSEP